MVALEENPLGFHFRWKTRRNGAQPAWWEKKRELVVDAGGMRWCRGGPS